jgi:hypothetical protein
MILSSYLFVVGFVAIFFGDKLVVAQPQGIVIEGRPVFYGVNKTSFREGPRCGFVPPQDDSEVDLPMVESFSLNVPVVFHVVHSATNGNIPDEWIEVI